MQFKALDKVRRFSVAALFFAVLALKVTGCGGEGDQRKSGTLATPIDFVEKAGEAQGKAEDANKTAKKK